jgi:outer membrane protein assembly factor BamA
LSLAAIGSELEFLRVKLEHSRFLALASKTTLALSARVGWIAQLGSTEEIPIQERFFNGGENSVRSFRESELGPVDSNGTPVGGEASTTATVELRQALGRRFQVAAFVDVGTVELQHQDVFRFTDPGFGIGLGLRYLLPIGPIRLDGAVNPDPGVGEADSALHLSVGFSF